MLLPGLVHYCPQDSGVVAVKLFLHQFSQDTGCSPEDLPEAMNNMEEWRERARDIHAGGTT